MSEFRRRLMMQKRDDQEALPVGCVRCEYLESTGTQWIDTEKVVYADEDLVLVYYFPYKKLVNSVFMGWRYKGSFIDTSQCYLNFNTAFSYKIMLFYGISADITTNVISIQTDVKSKLVISTLERKIFVDGVEQDGIYDKTFTLAYDGEKGSVFNNYLFALNNKGVASVLSSVRIYEYSLKDHKGNYTQHLIPILDKDGTACMYDTVRKKYHYNKGTKEFLYKILEQ